MSRCLVTGSSDGIGAKVAEVLEGMGHDVVRHARDEAKAARLREAGAGEVVVGDLASLASTRDMAAALRAGAPFDVVVHNAGWLPPEGPRPVTADGLERTFQVNALSAYLLTALLPLPSRLVYVSSDSIVRGRIDLDDLQHAAAWTADSAYADSKLAMTAIAFAVARRYPALRVNAVHPGWIRTKMSGFPAQGPASSGPRSAATRAERAGLPGPPASEASANKPAPLDVAAGADTPVWLSTSDEPATGQFFHDRRVVRLNEQAYDPEVQDALVEHCARLTGAALPPA
jgi:NAD(P)-dependent dehydrogenase (short-subunit alcohol dehydrogenase family)